MALGMISGATTGASIGSAFSPVGSVIGGVIGGIGGLFAGNSASKKQWEQEKESLALQYGYNEKLAQNNQQRNKDLWDYTNYENQRKHMEAAGLNPALMYGMGGGGGTSTGGGQASGVGLIQPQGMGLELQAANMMADVRLKNAEADKAEAEKDKTKGVDTEKAKAEIGLIKAEEALKGEMKDLTAANYFKTLKEQDKVWQECRALSIANDIAEETKEAKVEQVYQQNLLNTLTGLEKLSGIQLNEEEAKNLAEKTRWIAFDMETGRISAEAAKKQAETAVEELEKKYKFQNQENIRAWVFGSINALANGAKAVSEFLPIGKVIKVGEKVISKAFGGKGESKGWREITKEFTNEIQ